MYSCCLPSCISCISHPPAILSSYAPVTCISRILCISCNLHISYISCNSCISCISCILCIPISPPSPTSSVAPVSLISLVHVIFLIYFISSYISILFILTYYISIYFIYSYIFILTIPLISIRFAVQIENSRRVGDVCKRYRIVGSKRMNYFYLLINKLSLHIEDSYSQKHNAFIYNK